VENNKNRYSAEDLSLNNNPNLAVDSKKEQKDQDRNPYKVNFHSELINEIVGDLDITV